MNSNNTDIINYVITIAAAVISPITAAALAYACGHLVYMRGLTKNLAQSLFKGEHFTKGKDGLELSMESLCLTCVKYSHDLGDKWYSIAIGDKDLFFLWFVLYRELYRLFGITREKCSGTREDGQVYMYSVGKNELAYRILIGEMLSKYKTPLVGMIQLYWDSRTAYDRPEYREFRDKNLVYFKAKHTCSDLFSDTNAIHEVLDLIDQ